MAPPWRPPSWRRALGRGTEPCSVPVCQPALSGVWGGSSTSSMTILSENLQKVSCRLKRGRVGGRVAQFSQIGLPWSEARVSTNYFGKLSPPGKPGGGKECLEATQAFPPPGLSRS